MSERSVTHVHHDVGGGIAGLCGPWEPDRPLTYVSCIEAIVHIQNGEHSYYVEREGERVGVQISNLTGEFIAIPAGSKADILEDLPQCPDS